MPLCWSGPSGLLFHGDRYVWSSMYNHGVGYWFLQLSPEWTDEEKAGGFSSSRLSLSQARRGKTDPHNTPDNVED